MGGFGVRLAVLGLTGALAAASVNAYTLDGSSTEWSPLFYAVGDPDFVDDEKPGADESDIVGDASHAAVYTAFDDAGTPSSTDGSLAFRIRLGADENPNGFKHVGVVGLDVNGDAAIDILLVANSKGGSPEVAIRQVAGDGTSPDETGIDTGSGVSDPQSSSNFSWLAVSGVDPSADPDIDTVLNTEPDYFLSFEVDFQELVTEVDLLGLGITFDENSTVSIVAGTSTKTNSINQDWSGLDGTAGWASAWGSSSISIPMTVPEPSTGLLVGAGLLGLAAVGRLRAR